MWCYEPLSTIAACPLETDIFEWHANLRPTSGPYQGITFHMVMKFPENYPDAPPEVRLCTTLCHPNVFGTWICLDLLRDQAEMVREGSQGRGWTSGYSAQSVLLQLQSFLFEENANYAIPICLRDN